MNFTISGLDAQILQLERNGSALQTELSQSKAAYEWQITEYKSKNNTLSNTLLASNSKHDELVKSISERTHEHVDAAFTMQSLSNQDKNSFQLGNNDMETLNTVNLIDESKPRDSVKV